MGYFTNPPAQRCTKNTFSYLVHQYNIPIQLFRQYTLALGCWLSIASMSLSFSGNVALGGCQAGLSESPPASGDAGDALRADDDGRDHATGAGQRGHENIAMKTSMNGVRWMLQFHFLPFTLWLCQNSYLKWPLAVDFPMKNGDFCTAM